MDQQQVPLCPPPPPPSLPPSLRAFGHFEKPLFMELCKHVETKFVPSGAILFRPGQTDDSIYVVRNGLLRVYIVERVMCIYMTAIHLPSTLYSTHCIHTCTYVYRVHTYTYVRYVPVSLSSVN